jgi:hypothetical protein
MLLWNPNLSLTEIEEKLEQLKLHVPTEICISQIRSHFRSSLKVIEAAGMLRNRQSELPPLIHVRRRSRPKQLTKRSQRYGCDRLNVTTIMRAGVDFIEGMHNFVRKN